MIGVLAALRHRDATGEGQYVDIAMLDAAVAMTDLVTNFYSMGIAGEAESAVGIIETFAAGEGISSCSVCASTSSKSSPKSPAMVNGSPTSALLRGGLARLLRHRDPPRRRALGRIDDQPRGGRHSCGRGSCRRRELHPADIVADEHVAARNMLVAMEPPGGGEPVLIPGNPVKLSRMAEGPETRVPWLGEHNDDILGRELGLDAETLADLRERGVIE